MREIMERIKERIMGKIADKGATAGGVRKAVCAAASFGMFFLNGFYVQASANIGENIGNWFLKQIFWLAIVAIIVVVVLSAVKRNYVGVVITIIVGAVVLYLITNPMVLKNLGETLGNIFMNGSGS